MNLSKSGALQYAIDKLAKLEKRLNDTIATINKNTSINDVNTKVTRALLPKYARLAVAELADKTDLKPIATTAAQEHVSAATTRAYAKRESANKTAYQNYIDANKDVETAVNEFRLILPKLMKFADILVLNRSNQSKPMKNIRVECAAIARELRENFTDDVLPVALTLAALLEKPGSKPMNRDAIRKQFEEDKAALKNITREFYDAERVLAQHDYDDVIAKAKAEMVFG